MEIKVFDGWVLLGKDVGEAVVTREKVAERLGQEYSKWILKLKGKERIAAWLGPGNSYTA